MTTTQRGQFDRWKGSLAKAARVPAPGEWLVLVAGLALVFRYFWFMDDAFVYLRYVDNWVLLGRGLVFNQGEFVEGYSSPLWTLILGGLRWPGLSYPVVVGLLGALAFTAFWGLAVAVNRQLGPGRATVNLPLAYLAACYGVICYFTSGLETPLIQVTAAVFALAILNPASIPLQIILGMTPLLRPELLVPLAIFSLWSWLRTRKIPVPMIVSAVVCGGGWLVFRVLYYADFLPNTFYLKDMTDVAQGLRYVWDSVGPYRFHVLAIAVLLATLALKLGRNRDLDLRAAQRLVMAACALSVAVYVVRIGGDPRHYRYLAFPFVLLVFASGGIAEHFLVRWKLDRFRAVPLVVTLLIFAASFAQYPRQLDRHPFGLEAGTRQVDKINDAQWHRTYPAITYEQWGPMTKASELRAFGRANPDFQYNRIGNRELCVSAYVTMNEITIQSFGLTDAILARSSVPTDRPGHKTGLKPMAGDIARIYQATGVNRGPGMYRSAVERGQAPTWIRTNLEAIESIERKIYNRHRLAENLRAALKPPGRIELSPTSSQ